MRVPGTDGGSVPTKITRAGMPARMRPGMVGSSRPNTWGRITASSSLSRMRISCTAFSQNLSIVRAICTERSSPARTRMDGSARCPGVTMRQAMPWWRSPSARNEEKKSW